MRQAARPIPIDHAQIRAAARELVSRLLAAMEAEATRTTHAWSLKRLRAYNKGRGLVVQGPDLRVRSVTGKSLDVPLYVMPSDKPATRGSNRFVESAAYVRYDAKTRWSQVVFKEDLTGADLDDPKAIAEVNSVLIHEVTHAAELPLEPRDTDPEHTSDLGADGYFNLPVEVRAFMQQAADEVREAVASGVPFDRALDESPTWRRVRTRLNSRNRKTFLKGIYTAVEDAGLLPSARRVAARKRKVEPEPDPSANVWTVPGSAVFHHRAIAERADEIRRHGLPASKAGTFGAGVYLMAPEVDPDKFFLHAQAGKETVVFAAKAPGARVLRVKDGSNFILDALRALHGRERGVEVYETRSLFDWFGSVGIHTPLTGLIEHMQQHDIDGFRPDGTREVVIFDPRKVQLID